MTGPHQEKDHRKSASNSRRRHALFEQVTDSGPYVKGAIRRMAKVAIQAKQGDHQHVRVIWMAAHRVKDRMKIGNQKENDTRKKGQIKISRKSNVVLVSKQLGYRRKGQYIAQKQGKNGVA